MKCYVLLQLSYRDTTNLIEESALPQGLIPWGKRRDWDQTPEGRAAAAVLGPGSELAYDWTDAPDKTVYYQAGNYLLWFPPTAWVGYRWVANSERLKYAKLMFMYQPGETPLVATPSQQTNASGQRYWEMGLPPLRSAAELAQAKLAFNTGWQDSYSNAGLKKITNAMLDSPAKWASGHNARVGVAQRFYDFGVEKEQETEKGKLLLPTPPTPHPLDLIYDPQDVGGVGNIISNVTSHFADVQDLPRRRGGR